MEMQQSRPKKIPPFTTSIVQNPSIPTIYHDAEYRYHKTDDDVNAFLLHDLSVERLEVVEPWLKIAGRKMAARPLHRQAMMNRLIMVTEQADLHLTWQGSRIYIKPLPPYLLNLQFWQDNFCGNTSAEEELYSNAMGFLLSYIWLVPNECDFHMAIDENQHPRLLPKDLDYEKWRVFLLELVSVIDLCNPANLSTRYNFGELRINRLNIIYRVAWPRVGVKHIFRGYFYGYHDYGTFLERNFAWLVTAFAYVAIVLTAMQVGLATDALQHNSRFQDASYGFAVFSIVSLLVSVGIIILWILVLVMNDVLATLFYLRKVKKERKPIMAPIA